MKAPDSIDQLDDFIELLAEDTDVDYVEIALGIKENALNYIHYDKVVEIIQSYDAEAMLWIEDGIKQSILHELAKLGEDDESTRF